MATTQRGIADDELDESPEAVTKEVFKPYQCRCSSILSKNAVPHAGDIAEASSLSAIPLPPSSYPLFDAFPEAVVKQGKLSQLQLEGVLYACTRHQQILPSGERAGFFIGDGAGVGKGRQIAGVILDNFARGRRRHLWLSTSTDLHVDATRDMRDLGSHIPVINGCASLDAGTRALGLDKELREGVLFLTYSTLISAGRAGRSRLTQVLEWLVGGTNTSANSKGDEAAAALAAAARAWDGVLVFDECHKAKNFAPGKEAQSTKVASAVIELQGLLPNARVLYCSATGVSEVGNMAYMARMGLWGPASAFADFESFLDSMKKRGVSFMELLAMEMKAAGRYVARGLSFREAEFLQVEAPLRPSKVQLYDSAVQLWQRLRSQLDQALALSGIENSGVWKTFWSAHQRFFKLLCIDLKLETVLAESKAALASGMCVVIGLQSTGEAAADAMGLEPGPLPGFVSPCKELLVRFIHSHFPVLKAQSAEAAAAGVPQEAIPACRQMRQQLLSQVAALQLPANFLDVLVDELGGPRQVAEMTGRKGRVVRQVLGGGRQQVVYELRAKPDSSEMDSLNVSERDGFMSGKKRVALISDAASTGISLHAVATAVNRSRRLHLTVELPWSADKAIQQFGRSHRTNQLSAPIYKLVVSAAGGERRFAAAVARRLQSLGALTRGDRRAAAGVDLSDSNFDSPWGRKSLRRMYDHIVCESPQLPAGVTVTALMKDLLPTTTTAVAAVAAVTPEAQNTSQQQQQQQAETLKLLQAEIPALKHLQRLAAQEAAVAAAAAARAAAAAAAGGGRQGTPTKQQQQRRSSSQTPPQQQQQQRQQSPAAAANGRLLDEEAQIVAALTGRSPAGGSNARPAAAGGAAAFAAAAGSSAAGPRLMSSAEVAVAISELHRELRSCCDMMDIGLGGAPRKDDTVAEDRAKDAGISSSKASKDAGDVRRFLNRLLGLPLGRQNLLFNYFAATLAAEVAAAKVEGRYSEGVSDLQGSSIWLDRPRQLLWRADGSSSSSSGTPAAAAAVSPGGAVGDALGTWVNTLVVDRGSSYQDAQRRLSHEAFPGCSSGFFRSRRPMFGTHVVLLALQKPGLKNMFSIVRPNTGESVFDMERSDLDSKYVPVTPEEAQEEWVSIYTNSLTSCMHGAACTNKGHCSVGSRLSEVTILSGAVVRVWGVLESVLDRHAHELHKSERAMRVVRVAYAPTKPANAAASPPAKSATAKAVAGDDVQGGHAADGLSDSQQQQREQEEKEAATAAGQEGDSQQEQQQRQQSGTPSQHQQGSSGQGTAAGEEAAAVRSSALGVGGSSSSKSPGSPAKVDLAAAAAAGGAAHTLSLVGVRYPAHLLPEVAATLASLQEQAQVGAAVAAVLAAGNKGLHAATLPNNLQQQLQQQQLLNMSSWWKASLSKAGGGTGTGTQQPAAAAAAAAAAGALNEALGIARIEPPTPVDSKLREKAHRAPKTIFSFYGRAGSEPAMAAANGPKAVAAGAPAAAAGSMKNGSDAAPLSTAAAGAAKAKQFGSSVHLKGVGSSGSSQAVAGGSKQGSSSKQGQQPGKGAGKSNALLNCFSRMAAVAAAQEGHKRPQQQQQQQQQNGPPPKRQKAAVSKQQQRQLDLQQPKQKGGGIRSQQQQRGGRQQSKACSVQSLSSSVICIDSDSEVDAAVTATAAAATAGCRGSAEAAGEASTRRPKRSAAAAAGAKITAATAAAAAGDDDDSGGSDGADATCSNSSSSGADSEGGDVEGDAVCSDDSGRSWGVGGQAVVKEGKVAGSNSNSNSSRHKRQKKPPDDTSADKQQEQRPQGLEQPQQQQEQQGPVKGVITQGQRGGQETAAALELLAGMGFTGMQAERALWVAQGDVKGAIEFCLRG